MPAPSLAGPQTQRPPTPSPGREDRHFSRWRGLHSVRAGMGDRPEVWGVQGKGFPEEEEVHELSQEAKIRRDKSHRNSRLVTQKLTWNRERPLHTHGKSCAERGTQYPWLARLGTGPHSPGNDWGADPHPATWKPHSQGHGGQPPNSHSSTWRSPNPRLPPCASVEGTTLPQPERPPTSTL